MLLPFAYQGQSKIDNLSFENVENNLPKSWSIIGDSPATISVDNKERQDGQYSVLAQSTVKGMAGLMYTLPENYAGKKIHFRLYQNRKPY